MVIVSDNGEFATSIEPYLNPITGGLGSGAGQNNPGYGYTTPVEQSYQPPVSYGPSVEYAPSADPTGDGHVTMVVNGSGKTLLMTPVR